MHVKERKSLHKAKIYVRHKIVYFAAEKNITQFCRVKHLEEIILPGEHRIKLAFYKVGPFLWPDFR